MRTDRSKRTNSINKKNWRRTWRTRSLIERTELSWRRSRVRRVASQPRAKGRLTNKWFHLPGSQLLQPSLKRAGGWAHGAPGVTQLGGAYRPQPSARAPTLRNNRLKLFTLYPIFLHFCLPTYADNFQKTHLFVRLLFKSVDYSMPEDEMITKRGGKVRCIAQSLKSMAELSQLWRDAQSPLWNWICLVLPWMRARDTRCRNKLSDKVMAALYSWNCFFFFC